jgi:hypothetical protein
MKLRADYLPVHITTYCTLKCKDCANGIPRFRPQRHSDTGIIKRTLKKIFEVFEHTNELRLAGGEAFLHPDICEIMIDAAKYHGRFKRMVIATNATYLPKQRILETCAELDCGFVVNIDDYGKLSPKLNELLDALNLYNIAYVLHPYNDAEQYCGGWIDCGMDFTDKNYSDEELHRTFDVCRKNYYIFDGRMYGCCPASAAYELGLFRAGDGELVDLLTGGGNNVIRSILRLKEKPYAVCRCCNGFDVENGKRIKAAVQL